MIDRMAVALTEWQTRNRSGPPDELVLLLASTVGAFCHVLSTPLDGSLTVWWPRARLGRSARAVVGVVHRGASWDPLARGRVFTGGERHLRVRRSRRLTGARRE